MSSFFRALIGGITTVLMAVVYAVVFIPAGVLLRIAGKDPMARKWDSNAQTYWRSRK